MDDRSTLLNQLRIDQDDRTSTSGSRLWFLWLSIAVLAAAVSGVVWFRYAMAEVVTVDTVTAEAVSAAEGAQRGSILDASGYVIPRRQATVSSKITGKVIEVLIEEGQTVTEGEVIALLDDTNFRAAVQQSRAQLEHAEANLYAAEVAFENAQPTFLRNQEQFDQAVISAQAFDTAKAAYDVARTNVEVSRRSVNVARASLAVAERNLEDTIVRAPFAGVVTVKAAQEGEMVSPVSAGGGFTRTGIGTIVDMDSLEVEVDVSESFINRVHAGQELSVRLNAYPDWEIPGHVIAIIPTADRAKATVRVRVALEERDSRILPQMGVRVSFLSSESGDSGRAAQTSVIVPAEAVQSNGDTGVVFIVRDEQVERRAVRLGARTTSGLVVTAGLEPGMRLAVGNLSLLSDGTKVRLTQ